jgi:hypothetical protein
MKKILRRKPSASMVVAIAALVIAASGTAVATSSLVNGDKLIKKHSLSGNRLRNHTITGTQVNLGKLGKVPSAKNADHATSANSAVTAGSATSATSATSAGSATSATTAGTATNATNATNAASLNGMTRFRTTIQPAGASFTDAAVATVTLFADGPLSLVGKCYSSAGVINGSVFLRSSVAAHWTAYANSTHSADNPLLPGSDQDTAQYDAAATPPARDFEGPYDGTFAAITDDTAEYFTGLASIGANLNGSGGCTFAGWAMSS